VAAIPSDAELRLFRGRYRMDAHDCPGALDDFRAAEESRPDNALEFASAALAQMCMGDESGARASIERSLQLDPNQPMLHKMLGQ
jgi:Flp pilus assembly protein TadD